MTLGTGLVVLGLMAAYQQAVLNAGTELPDAIIWLGQGLDIGFLPNSLIVFIPIAAAILLGLRYTGFGRLLFAVGDNPIASRLAGARIWQVLVALYVAVRHARGGRGSARRRARQHRDGLAGRGLRAAIGRGGGHRRDVDHGRPRRVFRDDRRGADPDGPDRAPDRASLQEAGRQMLFGIIIVAVAAAYTRVTGES